MHIQATKDGGEKKRQRTKNSKKGKKKAKATENKKKKGASAAMATRAPNGSEASEEPSESEDDEWRRLRKTYYARHAPFSDGKDHSCFNGLVKTPSTWDEQRNEKVLPARKKRPRKVKKAAEKPKDSPTKRVYNLATGEFEFKEVISIDE